MQAPTLTPEPAAPERGDALSPSDTNPNQASPHQQPGHRRRWWQIAPTTHEPRGSLGKGWGGLYQRRRQSPDLLKKKVFSKLPEWETKRKKTTYAGKAAALLGLGFLGAISGLPFVTVVIGTYLGVRHYPKLANRGIDLRNGLARMINTVENKIRRRLGKPEIPLVLPSGEIDWTTKAKEAKAQALNPIDPTANSATQTPGQNAVRSHPFPGDRPTMRAVARALSKQHHPDQSLGERTLRAIEKFAKGPGDRIMGKHPWRRMALLGLATGLIFPAVAIVSRTAYIPLQQMLDNLRERKEKAEQSRTQQRAEQVLQRTQLLVQPERETPEGKKVADRDAARAIIKGLADDAPLGFHIDKVIKKRKKKGLPYGPYWLLNSIMSGEFKGPRGENVAETLAEKIASSQADSNSNNLHGAFAYMQRRSNMDEPNPYQRLRESIQQFDELITSKMSNFRDLNVTGHSHEGPNLDRSSLA